MIMKEKYPHIKEAVKSQLTAIRAAGLPVQGPLARMVLRAHIMHQQPSLLEPLSGFKLSMTWVRKFLRDELGWAERVATRQAKKVPANAKELCTRAHNRLTFAMAMNNVPPELVVNADQSGVTMMPTGKRTYEKKGAKNVPMLSHEEKRQVCRLLPDVQILSSYSKINLSLLSCLHRAWTATFCHSSRFGVVAVQPVSLLGQPNIIKKPTRRDSSTGMATHVIGARCRQRKM